MEQHLSLQTADNLRAGLSPSEARRQAVLKFGCVEAIQEEYWAEGGLAFVETVLQDFRFGWRSLRKSAGFTAVAVSPPLLTCFSKRRLSGRQPTR